MMERWFDPNLYAWIPGAAFGCVAGALGGLAGWLAPKGRARAFIVKTWIALGAAAIALLGLGIVALIGGQPWGVWYGLLLPGAVGTIVIGATLPVILKTYGEVELRHSSARDAS